MRKGESIVYEWDVETIDEYGDIIDHDHLGELSEINLSDLAENERLVLVRDIWEQLEGKTWNNGYSLKHRSWCYVEGDVLPLEFDDGEKVPQRFHKEFNQQIKNSANNA